jgi:hypothetical protein
MPGSEQQRVFLQSLFLALHCPDVAGAGSGAAMSDGPTGARLGLMRLIQRLVEISGGCVTGGSGI